MCIFDPRHEARKPSTISVEEAAIPFSVFSQRSPFMTFTLRQTRKYVLPCGTARSDIHMFTSVWGWRLIEASYVSYDGHRSEVEAGR